MLLHSFYRKRISFSRLAFFAESNARVIMYSLQKPIFFINFEARDNHCGGGMPLSLPLLMHLDIDVGCKKRNGEGFAED